MWIGIEFGALSNRRKVVRVNLDCASRRGWLDDGAIGDLVEGGATCELEGSDKALTAGGGNHGAEEGGLLGFGGEASSV